MMKIKLHNKEGERKDQLLTVVDRKGKPIGKQTREKCHLGNGITHLAFMMFLVDQKGRIILAKRSNRKTMWPGVWDATVVSHVLPGETPIESAKRRSGEEVGIRVEDIKRVGAFYYFKRQNGKSENEYCYVFLVKIDRKIKPNEVEIDKIKRVTFSYLKEEVKKHPDRFTPWLKIALDKFDLSDFIYEQKPIGEKRKHDPTTCT